jgi:hypothetical protein
VLWTKISRSVNLAGRRAVNLAGRRAFQQNAKKRAWQGKGQQRQCQNDFMRNKRVPDNNKVQEDQVKRSRLSRTKTKINGPEKAKADQNE